MTGTGAVFRAGYVDEIQQKVRCSGLQSPHAIRRIRSDYRIMKARETT
jgi:hypothetical protein